VIQKVHGFNPQQTATLAAVSASLADEPTPSMHRQFLVAVLTSHHIVLNANQLRQLSSRGSHAQCAKAVDAFAAELAHQHSGPAVSPKQAKIAQVLERAARDIVKITEHP
jgi:hypothetical protein